jgi:hypothetical protein
MPAFSPKTGEVRASLMRIEDVATLLNLKEKPAKRWLMEHRVPLIDFGPGRGLGHRWDPADVWDAIQRAKASASSPKQQQQRQQAQSFFTGRPAAEILKDLAASKSNRQ